MSKRKTVLAVMTVIIFLFTTQFCMIFSACFADNSQEGKLLRIHVRAHSNAAVDQQVKMTVKESVVNYLENALSGVRSLSEAIAIIDAEKEKITALCDKTLIANGMDYRSSVGVKREYFPTRAYENVIVEAGVYDALIIRLGEGEGDNWWCVIYPPLCFVGRDGHSGEIEYRSRIAELWRKFTSR